MKILDLKKNESDEQQWFIEDSQAGDRFVALQDKLLGELGEYSIDVLDIVEPGMITWRPDVGYGYILDVVLGDSFQDKKLSECSGVLRALFQYPVYAIENWDLATYISHDDPTFLLHKLNTTKQQKRVSFELDELTFVLECSFFIPIPKKLGDQLVAEAEAADQEKQGVEFPATAYVTAYMKALETLGDYYSLSKNDIHEALVMTERLKHR